MELVACTEAAVGPALLGLDAAGLAGALGEVDALLANRIDESAPPGLSALAVLVPDGTVVTFA
jgi:hypothetical protein